PLSPTAPTELSPLSLHDALPICERVASGEDGADAEARAKAEAAAEAARKAREEAEEQERARRAVEAEVAEINRLMTEARRPKPRSEEHTSELQSRENLVCRLLLE